MAEIVVDVGKKEGTINKNIYGHFAEHLGRCIYEGIWVGKESEISNTEGFRNDVLEALRNLKIPVLRWPGGCFADEYHWKDGLGPKEQRKRMINTNWGGLVENNHFGTHEFLRLCELLETEPYICGNVGSGTVREMSEWVEYMTFDGESPMTSEREKNGRKEPWSLTYFGIGNENWGCGGNMRAEYYSDLYKQFSTYVRSYGKNKIFKIAGGANSDDFEWTEILMKNASELMHGLSLHYYTIPGEWETKGAALGFGEGEWIGTLKKAMYVDELILKHSSIMDIYDPGKKVALIIDEWGTWYDVEAGSNPGFLYQQNSMRDAMVAGLSLNIFHNHNQRVKMANIGQTINVLQAVLLTKEKEMIKTPTYHLFDMYKVHQDALRVDLKLESPDYSYNNETIPSMNSTASIDSSGKLHISICHLDPRNSISLDCFIKNFSFSSVKGSILTSDVMDGHNTFEDPENVCIDNFSDVELNENTLSIKLPPHSIVTLELV